MKKLLLIALLIVGCENPVETKECAGVAGGTAIEDCSGECGGDTVKDECGICNGIGVQEGYTAIDGSCYYQMDLDVLQEIINVNEGLNAEPLKIGNQGWDNGRLDSLDLNSSHLTALPESLGNLSSLIVLDLTSNQFATLPESIGSLSSLQTLVLSWNFTLTTLPESIGNLSSLRALDLQNNQLTSLPESIGNLSSLEVLFLSDNQLTTLPESMCNIPNLAYFSFRGNFICGELPSCLTAEDISVQICP